MYDLVREQRVSTLSSDFEGTPFGSLVPYALDKEGNPIIFLSDLARHTKNLKKNDKCSLMVSKVDENDVFNSARITFVGKIAKVTDEEEYKILKRIFLDKNPEAKAFANFEDFNLYKLNINSIQYIGGFGDINWISAEDYRKEFKKVKGGLL